MTEDGLNAALRDVSSGLARLEERLDQGFARMDERLAAVEEQVTATNGRVTRLEKLVEAGQIAATMLFGRRWPLIAAFALGGAAFLGANRV